MKKLFAYCVMIFLLVGAVSAATMSRSMPDKAAPGETVTVTFTVSDMEVGKELAVSEILPAGWTVQDWSVSGSQQAKADVTYKKKSDTEYQWAFKAATASPSLSYTVVVPSTALGSYEFDAVYMLPPASTNNLKNTLTVRVIACGDNVCEGSETTDSCPADCQSTLAPPSIPPEEEAKAAFPWLWVIVGVAVVLIAAPFVVRKKKQGK